MRLVELTANQETFRNVRFNPTGLSLIVGRKTNPDDRSLEHSFNGVGKSLLLYLINFCLGSKENPQLAEKLAEWEFTLDYEIVGERHRVTRSTTTQKKVTRDGEEIDLDAFTEELGSQLFSLGTPSIKFLTFRSLVSLFLRQGKPAYIHFDQTADRERVYARHVRSAYLLGLDEALVDRKRELQEEAEQLKNMRRQFKRDSLLRDYYLGDRDAELELVDIEEAISQLETQVSEFRVAENYESIEQEAEETRRTWRKLRNELHGLESAARQIETSLAEQPELGPEQVSEMYETAKLKLPDLVTKELEEVAEFHAGLIESRARRLTTEKQRIERRIEEIKASLATLDKRRDEYFKFLGAHGALHEYEALLQRLADQRRHRERLQQFQALQDECQARTQKNKLEMSEENIRATEYLRAAKALTDELNDTFRSMAKRIWPRNASGLVVRNNEGKNLTRFTIEPKIQSDASDGIGETKIFCFDMTVLLGHHGHSMQCLMHDNRLYPGIDPRQRAELFRLAHELAASAGCQYIASMNDDNLTGMQAVMDDAEFESLLNANTVLELTDDSDAGKLLGIQVDLDYLKGKKSAEG